MYQFTLKNGLHVILSEDDTLPLVSVVVAYNVGSINEEPGKAGLACLLENLMFYGSKNVNRMQHIIHINKIGGILNATTTEESTIFHQTVPSNQLALVLWLESDRMSFLEITDSKIERARDSLIEEINHRKNTDPYLDSLYAFDQLLFGDFAYSHPVIGTENDLRNITLKDVIEFYSTYYTPNNAVLCIVGNIDSSSAEKLVRKYFESLPKGNRALPTTQPEEFKKKSAAESLREPLAPIPGFYLGYKLPSPLLKDYYPLAMIEYILIRGKSSRLQNRLYKRERIAFSFHGGLEKWRRFAAFKLFVMGNNDVMVEMSLKAVYSEINKLRTVRVPDKELTKAKNMFKANYVSLYSTTLDRALFLAESFLSRGSLDHLPSELDKYLKVTSGEIIGVMNRYFVPENRILLIVEAK